MPVHSCMHGHILITADPMGRVQHPRHMPMRAVNRHSELQSKATEGDESSHYFATGGR